MNDSAPLRIVSLSVGAFSDDGKLLLVRGDRSARMPGGIPTFRSLFFNNEIRIGHFVSQIMEEQTGITKFFLKNGKLAVIAFGVQDMPATYSVYDGTEVHQAIILGEVDSSSLSDDREVGFYSLSAILDFIRMKYASPEQEFLILRVLASRDNPNEIERKKAGRALELALEKRKNQ